MPYSVVIVDDEIRAIQHLRRMLDTCVPACTVTQTFVDARTALEHPLTQNADILIVDIMMPVMNGLDFSREHLAKNPHTKVVLLTSHRDFSFARKAVGIGVFDYWVKHELRQSNIARYMQSVMQTVDESRRIRQSMQRQRLLDALEGRIPLSSLHLSDGSGKYFLLYVADCSGKQATEPAYGWTPPAGMDQTVLSGFVPLASCVAAIGYVGGAGQAAGLKQYEQFCAKLEEYLRANGLCGLLSLPLDEKDYQPTFHRQCLSAVDNCVFGERPLKFLTSELLQRLRADINLHLYLEAEYFEGLARLAEEMEPAALQSGLQKLWQEPLLLAGNRRMLEYTHSRLEAILQPLLTISAGSLTPGFDLSTMQRYYTSFLDDLQLPNSKCVSCQNIKVRKIQAFIRKNYNGDLRLKTLTKQFLISGDHLRKLFKNETGQTLSEYITNVRLGEAKKLLKTGDYKIYEIAEMVGYNSSQYFSQAFYNATGRYPTEYL